MISEKNRLRSNNFFIRLISATLALVILLTTLFVFRHNGAYFLILVISTLISYELSNLFFNKNLFFKFLIPLITAFCLFLTIYNIQTFFNLLPIYFALILIPWVYRKSEIDVTFNKLTVYLLIVLYGYILPVKIYEIFNLDQNFLYFFFFCLLVCGVDTFAYIFGKILGRSIFKVSFQPIISPSKTVEGLLGSLLWPLLLIGLASQLQIFKFTLLSTGLIYLTAFAAISGDLIASLIKRKSKKKDSGQLFVGHGGFFDRLDSLLLSSPVYLIAAHYFHIL